MRCLGLQHMATLLGQYLHCYAARCGCPCLHNYVHNPVYTPYRNQLIEAETLKLPYKSHKLMGIIWAHTGTVGCIVLTLYQP